MIGVAVLSLLLLGASGYMIDVQRRSVRRRLANEGLAERDRRFFVRQNRWRTTANVMIGAVGVLLAVWPAVPRTRAWMSGYLALLLFAVVVMLLMALLDAWAISRRYRRDRMEQIAQEARHALEMQRKKLKQPKENAPAD